METNAERPKANEFKYLSDTLYIIGGKWTLLVMLSISFGNRKFSDIKRSIPDITPRALSHELKKLEENNLVKRKKHKYRIDTIDYEISSYCKSLNPVIQSMINWGKKHREMVRSK